MNNYLNISNDEVKFSTKGFKVEAFERLLRRAERHHFRGELSELLLMEQPVAPLYTKTELFDVNYAWWFLEQNCEINRRGVTIAFASGRAPHNWQTFRNLRLLVLSQFIKRYHNVGHHFVIAETEQPKEPPQQRAIIFKSTAALKEQYKDILAKLAELEPDGGYWCTPGPRYLVRRAAEGDLIAVELQNKNSPVQKLTATEIAAQTYLY